MTLTRDEKISAFRRATNSMQGSADRWADRAATGMTDEHLAEAMAYEMGIHGGFHGHDDLSVMYKGKGLTIWASRGFPRQEDPPIFSGQATIAAARECYGIADPSDSQMSLL